jgi:hypothetical protein
MAAYQKGETFAEGVQFRGNLSFRESWLFLSRIFMLAVPTKNRPGFFNCRNRHRVLDNVDLPRANSALDEDPPHKMAGLPLLFALVAK